MTQQSATSVPFEVPSGWSVADVSAQNGTPSLAQWWERFDDPLLPQLIDQALRANTSVTSAEAAVRQARALRDVSAAALLPSVSGSTSAQRSRAGSVNTNSLRAGLDASWELDIFGENRSALEASEAALGATGATLGDVQVSIAAEVALDYISLRGLQARLVIAQDNLETQLETLQITEWRLQAGLAPSLDAEQARASTEQTQALVPQLQTSIEQTRHALSVLTGQPPAALATMLAGSGPIPKAPDTLAIRFPAETLRQRADVRAAEYQVSAAIARVAQADAARYPSFGSASARPRVATLARSRAARQSSPPSRQHVGPSSKGAPLAQVRAQQAALDQARSAYQATVLTALKDVEDALVALEGDRDRLRTCNSPPRLPAMLRCSRASATARASSISRRCSTRSTQLTTQEGVANASTDLGADHVRLYKALGGGWNPRWATRRRRPINVPRDRDERANPTFGRRQPAARCGTERSPIRRRCSTSRRGRGISARRCGGVALAAPRRGLVLAGAGTVKAAPVYTTEPVRRGNLTLTVTANGTLQPTRSIAIGSELSGTVKVNVDVNDHIKKGRCWSSSTRPSSTTRFSGPARRSPRRRRSRKPSPP
jgi:NodT family efflux transporter outer membrane factor (OMF) lipoprotein